jgi:hypothetical protein
MRFQALFRDRDREPVTASFALLPAADTSSPAEVIGHLRFVEDTWVACYPFTALGAGGTAALRIDWFNRTTRWHQAEIICEPVGGGRSVPVATPALAPGRLAQRQSLTIPLGKLAAGEYRVAAGGAGTVPSAQFTIAHSRDQVRIVEATAAAPRRAPLAQYPGNADPEQVHTTYRYLAGGGRVLWAAGQYDAASAEFAHGHRRPGPLTVDAQTGAERHIPWALFAGRDALDGTHEPLVLQLTQERTLSQPTRYPETAAPAGIRTSDRRIAGRGRWLLLIGVVVDESDRREFAQLRVRGADDTAAPLLDQTLAHPRTGQPGARHAFVLRLWLEQWQDVVRIDNPAVFAPHLEFDFMALLESGPLVGDRAGRARLQFGGDPTAQLFTAQIAASKYLLEHYLVDTDSQIYASLPGGRTPTPDPLSAAVLASELTSWGWAGAGPALKRLNAAFDLNAFNPARALTVIGLYNQWRRQPTGAAESFLNSVWDRGLLAPLSRVADDAGKQPLAPFSSDGEFGGGDETAATIPIAFTTRAAVDAGTAMAAVRSSTRAELWKQAGYRLRDTFADQFVAGDKGRTLTFNRQVPGADGIKPQRLGSVKLPAHAWIYGFSAAGAPLAANGERRVFDTPYLFAGLRPYIDVHGMVLPKTMRRQLAATLDAALASSPLFRRSNWRRSHMLDYGPAEVHLWAVLATLLLDRIDDATPPLTAWIRSNYDEHAPRPADAWAEVSPYTFEARPRGSPKRSLGSGGDDLNARCGAAALQLARVIAGIDDHDPVRLHLQPRLPPTWDSVTASNWVIGHSPNRSSGAATINFGFTMTRRGTPNQECRLTLKSSARLEEVSVRIGPFPRATNTVVVTADNGRNITVPLEQGERANWLVQSYRRLSELNLHVRPH